MNPLAQHFLNILRISPNEIKTENPSSQPKIEDDASSFLKGDGVKLSDSQGNILPIFFEKANEEGNFFIIKTKASSPITVDGDLVLHNSLLTTNTLKVGDLKYPDSAPTDNDNNITWVMGGTKSTTSQNLTSLEWFDLDAKFETVKDKLINDGMSVYSIPENVILYHAMPYKRFMFYKDNIDENGEPLPTLKDFILCDGKGNTPNLYREDPTFIRGLNFAYAYKNDKGDIIKNYIHDETNNALISLNDDTNEFKIGYYEVIASNEDIQLNECNYYPKNIKAMVFYPATTNYLTPKTYNHRHLLFTGLSGETDLTEDTDNQPSMCTFTTIAEENSFTLSRPKGYEPLLPTTTTDDQANDDWDKYCSGENNYFHGLLPIPTSDSIEAGIHPISKTGFIPFEYHHKIKADDKEPLIKTYTGKYELHGIEEEEEDNNSLLYNSKYTEVPSNYIWRSVTSLPIFLEQTEDKISINTNVMHKEEEPKKPNPTFINLLPLMCKPKN